MGTILPAGKPSAAYICIRPSAGRSYLSVFFSTTLPIPIILEHTTVRIGTRGSKLALWQAYYVEERLQAAGLQTEIVLIETKGDKILDTSLAKIGSKGVFTEELEEQLRDGRIHIAVHSAKDVQSELHEDFELIAFTERERANDVLVSYQQGLSLSSGKPFVVGTSSVRRVSTLKAFYPHIQVVDVRGNLQTRMRKLQEGHCDALLLAYAGVHRMGYEEHICEQLPLERFTPAVGQGSVAIEACTTLEPALRSRIRQALNHEPTEYRLRAERAFLRTLQGGCSIPAFCLAELDGAWISLSGGLVAPQGEIRLELRGDRQDGERLGSELAQWVLDNGGREVLSALRQQP